jgi:hypothetical protein
LTQPHWIGRAYAAIVQEGGLGGKPPNNSTRQDTIMNQVRTSKPYPIRQKSEKWEVTMIVEGDVMRYFLCNTRQEAEAISDARPLFELATMRPTPQCEVGRVRRCIDALARHGFDRRTTKSVLAKLLENFAERLEEEND